MLDGDECVATHKEKSRLAQKRFRQRQKVCLQNSEFSAHMLCNLQAIFRWVARHSR